MFVSTSGITGTALPGPGPQENNGRAKVEKINTRNEKLLQIEEPAFMCGNILIRNVRANPIDRTWPDPTIYSANIIFDCQKSLVLFWFMDN
jgi:hypothetical protein